MKFLLCLVAIMNIYRIYAYRLKAQEENYIIKMTDNYYEKIGQKNINEFKNMIFRELDQKTGVWDKNLNAVKKNPHANRTDITSIASKSEEGYKNFIGEYASTNRLLKFYISHTQDCSVFINDTVHYENLNNANFVEHMILHNNAELIDPKGVYSDEVNINFFLFNKKLNIFSVYFDGKKPKNSTNLPNSQIKNFSIEYDYDAIGIIKSHFEKDINGLTSDNSTINYNSFIWKILNQNFLKVKENVTIELYFDLGKDFEHEDVEFSLNFTKSIIDDDKKNIVKYQWSGSIDPQEVVVLQVKFPLYFEHCGNLKINLVMILVGSVFIVFMIGMLYIILSTVFSEDIF